MISTWLPVCCSDDCKPSLRHINMSWKYAGCRREISSLKIAQAMPTFAVFSSDNFVGDRKALVCVYTVFHSYWSEFTHAAFSLQMREMHCYRTIQCSGTKSKSFLWQGWICAGSTQSWGRTSYCPDFAEHTLSVSVCIVGGSRSIPH